MICYLKRTPHVGVRNLNATHEKYLFRSLHTRKADHHSMVCFSFLGRGIEDSHHSSQSERGTAMCRADTTHNAGYGIRIAVCAYPDRRSKSSLFRRRAWVSSPQANTPIQNRSPKGGRFSFFWPGNRGFSPQLAKRAGFAFERKLSGSLLTSGEAKNPRRRRVPLFKTKKALAQASAFFNEARGRA